MSLYDLWYKSKTDGELNGFPAVVHKLTKEKCIVGHYGEIWENSDTTLKCAVNSSKMVSKVASFLNLPTPKVDKESENVFIFNKTQLNQMVKLLKCPSEAGRQLTIMKKRAA